MPRFSVIKLDDERVFLKDAAGRTAELPASFFVGPLSVGDAVLLEAVRTAPSAPLDQPLARAVLSELLSPSSPPPSL